jgi:hypothetical protein
MAKLTGTNPDQVPTNADLGDMAYKDGESLQAGPLTITDGKVGIGTQSPTEKLHVRNENTNTYAPVALFQHYDTDDSTLRSEAKIGSGENTYFKTFVTSGSTDFLIVDQDSNEGRLSFQVKGNAGSTDSFAVDCTGRVEVRSGKLRLDGNDIGGTQVTIADDAVASITPPRNGGFMMMTLGGESTYPLANLAAMIYYDVGASIQIEKCNPWGTYTFGSSDVDVSTSDVTGTTGTDSHATVAVQSGVIKIENRVGSSRNFQITFL